MSSKISRRIFLEKSSLGALGLASMGILTGCAPKTATPTKQAATEIPMDSDTNQWDYEPQILVIGAGVAGLAAAIEASDLGFDDVLVLEYLPYMGGDGLFVRVPLLVGIHKCTKNRELIYH